MRRWIRHHLIVLAFFVAAPAVMADVAKGLAAYDVGDYETSLAECQPAAEEGDPAAQFCVGRLYANGFGVAMDDAQALRWYGLAAEQGDAEAQFNLGVMNANGWGVPMDDAAAAGWFRKAAEQGFVQAQTSLADLCDSGRGVEQNTAEAYLWYAIATALGDYNAGYKRDDIRARLSVEEITDLNRKVDAWLDAHGADSIDTGYSE